MRLTSSSVGVGSCAWTARAGCSMNSASQQHEQSASELTEAQRVRSDMPFIGRPVLMDVGLYIAAQSAALAWLRARPWCGRTRTAPPGPPVSARQR